MKFRKIFLLSSILLFILALHPPGARAQEEQPKGPIYIVETGDTLSSIALRFGVSVDDLVAANNLEDANALFVGDRLVIPGLEGIRGILETSSVAPGENLRSLSRSWGIPMAMFVRLNRLLSPAELHSGASLVLARGSRLSSPYRTLARPGESLLETALRSGENPWSVSETNGFSDLQRVIPGDLLFLNQEGDGSPLGLPRPVESITISDLYQGETAGIEVTAGTGIGVAGQLGPYSLVFNKAGTVATALQGLHALLEPGMFLLKLAIELPDSATYDYAQYVRVYPRDYVFEYITVDPSLIDPATTEAEEAMLQPMFEVVSSDKLWNGAFMSPSPFDNCINSTFGNRRSYNGSAFSYYHSGVDFCGGTGVEILAPAGGTVVYTGQLDVRGNFTLIDHGWGIFTTYMHQSEIFVQPGDTVTPGQVIGLIGNTGRSTGPHLHWEVWVHGVAVNPLEWLARTFP